MSLARKTVHGLFWVSFSNGLLKIINFIITIILARILEPAEFGLFSLALIVMYFFDLFRDCGMSSALIYKKEDVDMASNSAFFLYPLIGSVFFFISYFTAPIIADFFREEQLVTIIRILSLTNIIWSFGSLPLALLDKNLEFKKQVYRQIIPKIVYGIITILLALWGFGVWSLVIGTIVFWILSVLVIWNLV
jgi:O-antigen/teichoic acid export membrane protein